MYNHFVSQAHLDVRVHLFLSRGGHGLVADGTAARRRREQHFVGFPFPVLDAQSVVSVGLDFLVRLSVGNAIILKRCAGKTNAKRKRVVIKSSLKRVSVKESLYQGRRSEKSGR